MEDYSRKRSYGNGEMQIQPYNGGSRDFRSYSASYGQTQMDNPNPNPNDFEMKKGKSFSGSKSWRLSDPEFGRKKRVAGYKMYTAEGKVRGSLRNSFRWIKRRCSQVVDGWL
ncbi:PREDICTED: uncharacterized protein LOC104799158 [Tarenaya hassleriana]|uniref:uncharacterized protein LOC104799158 n=1 Tax=Tarenaya hassleriana TaxID=28532 RepID=UPI00053C679A|nr:PREDICTED: uncharacterized protein LOC104799158 [Tarenaya hassleriana]